VKASNAISYFAIHKAKAYSKIMQRISLVDLLFKNRKLATVFWVCLFAIVGVVMLLFSHAAAPYISIEAESATLIGNVSPNTDTTASNNQSVQFKQPTASSGMWTPSSNTPINFQWILGGTMNTADAYDLGQRDLAGTTITSQPDVYDIDGEMNTKATVDY
jgi:hypothetical protein